MKQTVIDSVQAGINQISFAGAPSSVAIWLSMAAITGIGKKDNLHAQTVNEILLSKKFMQTLWALPIAHREDLEEKSCQYTSSVGKDIIKMTYEYDNPCLWCHVWILLHCNIWPWSNLKLLLSGHIRRLCGLQISWRCFHHECVPAKLRMAKFADFAE
jgi:hypothetical protein